MKNFVRTLAVGLALGATGVVFTGCAGTPTSKSTGEFVDDAAITAKVKAEFVRDPIVKALQVHVDTFKGTVQLHGFVDTVDQRARAEQIARNTPGVVNVQNALTVKTQVAP